MAVTSIHPIRTTEHLALAYIVNGSKTDNGKFVTSFGCSDDPKEAAMMFKVVRETWNSKVSVLCQHMIQSFKPGEITPEKAHECGLETARAILGEDYQFVLATHVDRGHIHNHLIFNNVNMNNGYSFETLENKGHKRSWKTLREESDNICKEHKLSIIEEPEKSKGTSHHEWSEKQKGRSWKAQLKKLIDSCITESENFADFLRRCSDYGITADYRPERKISLKFKLDGQERWSRAKTLGWYYEPEQITERIKICCAAKRKSVIIDTSSERIQQSKALERWADIRNMKNVSCMINKLEEYNIHSTEELKKRSNTELAKKMMYVGKIDALDKEIKELESKISIIKKYLEMRKYAKEYHETTGFFKKRKYEKDHAYDLEEYAELREQVKAFVEDGKLPKIEKLEERLRECRQSYAELNANCKQASKTFKELDKCRREIENYRSQQRKHEKAINRGISR